MLICNDLLLLKVRFFDPGTLLYCPGVLKTLAVVVVKKENGEIPALRRRIHQSLVITSSYSHKLYMSMVTYVAVGSS